MLTSISGPALLRLPPGASILGVTALPAVNALHAAVEATPRAATVLSALPTAVKSVGTASTIAVSAATTAARARVIEMTIPRKRRTTTVRTSASVTTLPMETIAKVRGKHIILLVPFLDAD